MALRVGLTGKMTSTTAGPELSDKLAELIDEIGPYPHAALNADLSGRKKQSTRMLKVTCQACGCIVRMTAKWIEDAGAPTEEVANELAALRKEVARLADVVASLHRDPPS